jgi:hypothetical protein
MIRKYSDSVEAVKSRTDIKIKGDKFCFALGTQF